MDSFFYKLNSSLEDMSSICMKQISQEKGVNMCVEKYIYNLYILPKSKFFKICFDDLNLNKNLVQNICVSNIILFLGVRKSLKL